MKTLHTLRADLVEKTLTPAEKKKREEIAQAIERENPGMPMSKKMAIATAQAKKVAEETELEEATHILSGDTEFMKKHAKAEIEKVGGKVSHVTHDEDSGTSEYHVTHDQRDRIVHASKQLEKKGGESYGGLVTEEQIEEGGMTPGLETHGGATLGTSDISNHFKKTSSGSGENPFKKKYKPAKPNIPAGTVTKATNESKLDDVRNHARSKLSSMSAIERHANHSAKHDARMDQYEADRRKREQDRKSVV